jgi:hypothetical protein
MPPNDDTAEVSARAHETLGASLPSRSSHTESIPRDPELILARLPERYRPQFLAEYEAAAEAAAHEVWRYKQLQELLQSWLLRATAYSQPGFAQRRADAGAGRGEYVSLDQVLPRRQHQR